MADNTILPGTGENYAADDVGGVKHQRVKVGIGTGGYATDVSASDPMPVVQQDPDDSTRQAELDVLFKCPIVIGVLHHEIHEQDAFSTHFVDEAMGDNDTIILAFKTPAGVKRAHMWFSFSTLVGGDLVVWEGATWTTETGTLIDIQNRFRAASMKSSVLLEDTTATPTFTATSKVIANPTGLGTGSAVEMLQKYAWGIKSRASAGENRDANEWVLKPGTQYAVVFTAEGGSNKALVEIDWYEHTDG